MHFISFFSTLFLILIFKSVSGAVLGEFLSDSSACEFHCDDTYPSSAELQKSCAEGCRLFKIISLAKGYTANNKTLGLCFAACAEAFINESTAKACNYGCQQYVTSKSEDETQTIHLLTPLFYMRSAYNTMAHHVRQFISASWTVYVQEDSGKMVVLQTNPKVYENTEYVECQTDEDCQLDKACINRQCIDPCAYPGICAPVKDRNSYAKVHQMPWQEDRLDWMDCISHQSGIPRWLLVIVLFGFIITLLWLCCATAVTAPNHYLSSKKKNVSYVLLCEPNQNDLKPPPPLINCDEDAPPLPPKVSLI